MSERFKEHAWKACVGEILPWVRIPLSPPYFPHATRLKAYDLSQVQRAAGRQAGSGRAEIPATPRVSRAWLAAGENYADQDALSQRPAGLVAEIAPVARARHASEIKRRMN
jgi:hypothetical protein